MIPTPGQVKQQYGIGGVNVETEVRAAAGWLVLLYLPTYSPRPNHIEMPWRHFRRGVIHCELYETLLALVDAAYDFFG